MNIMTNFSERLSELMFEMSLTSDQLGKNIGVDGSAVRFWKLKKAVISLSNAIKIADYFNCSLEYLFGRSDTLIDFAPRPALPFYERLISVMKDKQISRYRVCADLKKGHGHFDRWKSGVNPRMNTVFDLAVYLDVTLDYLVGRDR